jgi:6-pyruvoyl-tetrahydropterin synthase
LKVAIEGPVSEMTGMVMDYYDIKAQVQPIVDRLDHRHLGHGIVETTVTGIPVGYIPTSENMLLWIADELPTTFPWTYLEINETCTSSAILSHEEWLYTRVSHLFGKEDDNVETSN